MVESVAVNPALIDWAIVRSQLSIEDLRSAFPKLDDWLTGNKVPTFRQLELFASKTMTPLGYFFLNDPPEEKLPIPDFRTKTDERVQRPSPNLIETIQVMIRRQTWMREFVVEEGQPPLPFVGSAKTAPNIASLSRQIQETMGLNADWAEGHSTWEEALRTLRGSAERIGILVVASSVVGLNNHRQLDPEEFRGFVLCDEYVPLIFINTNDSKSAQMFTLAHELIHVWIGRDGLFNLVNTMPHKDSGERFCNEAAAEFLVPEHKLRSHWDRLKQVERPFHAIAKMFKVSPVVAARRALDLRLITKEQFFAFYERDQHEWKQLKFERKSKKKGGPNFYDVQDLRLGRRFAQSVVRAAKEGRLLYRDAYQLTDLKGDTFDRYASIVLQRSRDERW